MIYCWICRWKVSQVPRDLPSDSHVWAEWNTHDVRGFLNFVAVDLGAFFGFFLASSFSRVSNAARMSAMVYVVLLVLAECVEPNW